MASRILELLDKKIEEVRDHLAKLEAFRAMVADDELLIFEITKLVTSPEVNGRIVRTASTEDLASALVREIGLTPKMPAVREIVSPPAGPMPKNEASEVETEPVAVQPTGPSSPRVPKGLPPNIHIERNSRLPKIIAYLDTLDHHDFIKARDIADACGLDRSNIYPLLDANPDLFEKQFGPRGTKWYRRKATT